MNLRRLIWNSRWLTDKQRIEWYPGFWLMRLKVLEISPCWHTVRILLRHSWIATNAGGSLFGGFQACLADPIAAMSCAKLFPGYSVWTRSLHLDFRHEGRSTPEFTYAFYQSDGALCTEIRARIAIRPKGYKAPKSRQ
jgi:hypothetical protein